MTKTSRSLLFASIALIAVIAIIAITFDYRRQLGWWAFMDCFTLFMTVFTWLMSIAIGGIIPHSGKVLQKIAIILAVLSIVAFIAEYLIYIF